MPATYGDRIPGNLVRFANGRGAFVLDKGGGKMGFQFLSGKVKPEDMDRIPLYDKNDAAAKARYLAAARASKIPKGEREPALHRKKITRVGSASNPTSIR